MKKIFGKWMFVVLMAVVLVLSMVGAGFAADDNTITVTGTGKVMLTPDMVILELSVNTEADTIQAAISKNTESVDQIRAAVVAAGVAESDIITSNYSVWSNQTYYRDNSAPLDQYYYTVNNYFRIVIRDVETLNDVLDSAIAAGANNINNISYDYSKKDESYAEARRLAIADANAIANEIADSIDKTVIDIVAVTDTDFTRMDVAYYDMMGRGGGGTPSMNSGSLEVTVSLSVKYLFE